MAVGLHYNVIHCSCGGREPAEINSVCQNIYATINIMENISFRLTISYTYNRCKDIVILNSRNNLTKILPIVRLHTLVLWIYNFLTTRLYWLFMPILSIFALFQN